MSQAFWRGVGSILGLFPRRRTAEQIVADAIRDIDREMARLDARLSRY